MGCKVSEVQILSPRSCIVSSGSIISLLCGAYFTCYCYRGLPCWGRGIFRHLSQAAWMVHISRSSALHRGGQDCLQPCGPNRKHTGPTCITLVLSLRTPYTARDCGHGGTRNRRPAWSLHT